jgi:hypothetical protein
MTFEPLQTTVDGQHWVADYGYILLDGAGLIKAPTVVNESDASKLVAWMLIDENRQVAANIIPLGKNNPSDFPVEARWILCDAIDAWMNENKLQNNDQTRSSLCPEGKQEIDSEKAIRGNEFDEPNFPLAANEDSPDNEWFVSMKKQKFLR